ncbi:MAG: SprB repeat-containing protein, partial [Bacteroidota bacterium]
MSLDSANVSCFGANDGFIEVINVEGGMGNLEYSIDNGPFSASPMFGSLSPGEHIVTVRDELGCTISQRITLTEPIELFIDLGQDEVINTGDSILITPSFNFDPNTIDSVRWTVNGEEQPLPGIEFYLGPTATTEYEILV